MRYWRFLPRNWFFAKKFTNFGCIFLDHQLYAESFCLRHHVPLIKTNRRLDPFLNLEPFFYRLLCGKLLQFTKKCRKYRFCHLFLYNSRSKLDSKKKRIEVIFCIFVRIPNLQTDFFLAYLQFPENALNISLWKKNLNIGNAIFRYW